MWRKPSFYCIFDWLKTEQLAQRILLNVPPFYEHFLHVAFQIDSCCSSGILHSINLIPGTCWWPYSSNLSPLCWRQIQSWFPLLLLVFNLVYFILDELVLWLQACGQINNFPIYIAVRPNFPCFNLLSNKYHINISLNPFDCPLISRSTKHVINTYPRFLARCLPDATCIETQLSCTTGD